MKKTFWSLAVICSVSTPALALANEISVDLNPDAFHLQVDATHSSNGAIYSGELLLTADNGEMAAIALKTNAQVGNNSNLSGGFGGKIYAIDDKTDTFGALSIGGRLQYTIPSLPELSLATEIFYAPTVTTTGDTKSLIDFTAQVEYAMFENASLYGGVRHIETKYDGDFENEIESNLHAGIRIDF